MAEDGANIVDRSAPITYITKGKFWLNNHAHIMNSNLVNLLFLKAVLDKKDYRKYNSGTAQPKLNSDIVKKLPVQLTSKKEQNKIGLFLSCLDNLITLYQRKLDLLKQLKHGMLQKLFTNSEDKQPILRFNRFYGDWEQCKLGNVFNERKVKSSEGQLLSVSISNGVYPFNEKNRKNNSSSNKSNYKLVEINDIAYNSMRMWQGAEGYSNYNGIVSPAYTVITPKEQESSLFFSFMFKHPKMLYVFQTHSQGLTSDTWNLKYPSFKQIVVIKPKLEEQERISTILIKIDKLISLYQSKINTLTTLKKFLLQQMFI